jgi:MOSC domain-containing protein YiiM
MAGVVESIHIARVATELPDSVERATAVAGRGLEGDRYFEGAGTFSGWPGERDLTLIAAEAVERLAAEAGIEIEPGEARRNVVTRGIDLNELVGRRFRVGAVECEGLELSPPCRHLEKLTKPGVLRGLASRGGLRAAITEGGEIGVGDRVGAAD